MLKRAVAVVVPILVLGMFLVSSSFAALAADSRAYLPSVLRQSGGVPQPFGPAPEGEPPTPALDTSLSAVALKQSLSGEQQQALAAVMGRYNTQLSALVQESAAPAAARTNGVLTDSAQLEAQLESARADLQAAQAAMQQLKALQAQIDSEVAAILTPEQLALHQQATSDEVTASARAAEQASAAAVPQASSSKLAADSGYCWYGASYASLAQYYTYWAYYYAYINYVYYDSDDYAYYGYYYLYYAHYYGYEAVSDLAGGYFDLINLGSDFNGHGYNGYNEAYYAYLYSYYGYYYSWYNYYYTGGSAYAYYAYYYGYYYANYYWYYAYVYGSYCY
jgi:hypothetical protein